MPHTGDAPSLAQNKTFRLILLWVGALAISIVIGILVYHGMKKDSFGSGSSASNSSYTLNQNWQEIKFPPQSWFRLDPIDVPIRIKLLDGREFIQYPGHKPKPAKHTGIGGETGLDSEIPGLRLFVKAEGAGEAKLEVSVWPK